MLDACPCCGSTCRATEPEIAASMMSPVMGLVVRRLSKNIGEFVSKDELARYVYAQDPSGGPEHAHQSIHNAIQYGRPRLAATGWRIEGRRGRHGGYRLALHENALPTT